MKVIFRTDASLHIGSGHVMRCLTLADALKADGAQCHFICREHPGNLIAQIRQRNFSVIVLPPAAEATINCKQKHETHTNYEALLGVDWDTDAAQAIVGIGGMVVDWLIVEHYALDARWEQTLRPMCRSLMVIDDLANRPHDCDLLLDQNLGRNVRDYGQLVPLSCTVLVGPHYALLRSQFVALRDESLRRRAVPQLKRLLITMGGVDQADATGKVLEALHDCQLLADLHITVVMGPYAPWLERVQGLAKQMPQPTDVMVSVDNIAQLMSDSDLAVGAAGSTSWERCCLGLPSIIVVLAANQQLIANALELSGAAKVFSINEGMYPICELIAEQVKNNISLRNMSISAAEIVDGNGAVRIAAQLKTTLPV